MLKLSKSLLVLTMLWLVSGCVSLSLGKQTVEYIPVYPSFPTPSQEGMDALEESDPDWLVALFKLCKKLKTEAVCPQEGESDENRG